MRVKDRHVYGLAVGFVFTAVLVVIVPSMSGAAKDPVAVRVQYAGAPALNAPSAAALEAAAASGGVAGFFNAKEAITAAAPSEPPPTLLAIVGVHGRRWAYLSAGGAPVKVGAGEVMGTWSVERVGRDTVDVLHNGARVTLKLFSRGDDATGTSSGLAGLPDATMVLKTPAPVSAPPPGP